MTLRKSAFYTIRIILSVVYLWVVADRLSFLGGTENWGVVWGNFESFLSYTHTLNPWFPTTISDFLAYFVTFLEMAIAFLLLSGIRLKEAALASFLLLIIFTLSMTLSLGFMAAIDFIVFTLVLAIGSGILYRETIKNT